MTDNQTTKTRTEELAARIAERIFICVPNICLKHDLETLLIAFADEIKRSAIEP